MPVYFRVLGVQKWHAQYGWYGCVDNIKTHVTNEKPKIQCDCLETENIQFLTISKLYLLLFGVRLIYFIPLLKGF